MTSVSFVVPGDPVAKGRPRFGRGRTYTPARTVKAENDFGWVAKTVFPRPLVGPLELRIVFYTATLRHSDTDNLVKLASDAMNKIAYLDDSQLWRIDATRFLDRVNPRTEVTLTAIERSAA